MTERLKPKLAGIGRPLGKALCLCFDDEIILSSAHRAGQIATEGDLRAGQVILRGMVDVDTRDIERTRRREVIDFRLDAVGVSAPIEIEVLGDELAGPRMTANQSRLPREILGDQACAETRRRRRRRWR